MLKLCLATLQALLKDYRLKFFELSSEINGGLSGVFLEQLPINYAFKHHLIFLAR